VLVDRSIQVYRSPGDFHIRLVHKLPITRVNGTRKLTPWRQLNFDPLHVS
jgi:hypothetical protein